MTHQAQTIQIFLPQGEPRGIRIADITTRIVQVVVVPRSKLLTADRPELNKVGLYFLFAASSETGTPEVYIGEAEDCLVRLKQHNAKLDFWSTAAVVTSKTDNLTKAHGRYLEWLAITRAAKADRYVLHNSTSPSQPHVTEPQAAEMEEVFETAATLLSSLGYPVFEALRAKRKGRTMYFTRSDFSAEGQLTDDGFVVFKGSTVSQQETHATSHNWAPMRKKLFEEGVLEEADGTIRFSRDHLFGSPSTAGAVANNHNVNGWIVWKDKEGRTLDALYRSSDKNES
jgi:hypothetical protein